ncbi:MAG: copper chaperone PCu(A)C [Alphaproteobacteria bacterium]
MFHVRPSLISLHLTALAVCLAIAAYASAEPARLILAAQPSPTKVMDHGARHDGHAHDDKTHHDDDHDNDHHDHHDNHGDHDHDAHHDGGHAAVGPVSIDGAYVRESLGRAPNSGAYLTLRSTAPDRLVAVESPAAERVELHTHMMDNDNVMRMRPVDGIDVAPGAPTLLQPGGFHIMLLGVHAPLVAGATIPLTLTFEKAGSVSLEVPVRRIAERR